MINEAYFGLCQSVARITRKPVNFHVIPKEGFRYPARIAEVHPFINQLERSDLEHFKRLATFSIENSDQNKRTEILHLRNPFEVDGRTILSLRLKGVLPRASENGKVFPYLGRGYTYVRIDVKSKDTIYGHRRGENDTDATGTMAFAGLKTEAESALSLGPDMTDLLLGAGVYETLNFNDQPVGFAIYGMERNEDIRMSGYLFAQMEKHGMLPDARNLAIHTGELLRKMGNLVHRTAHLGNYALISKEKAKIVDLEGTLDLKKVAEEEKASYLYLNMYYAIDNYMKARECPDGNSGKWIKFNYLRFLPFFFWGYFNGDTSIPFVRKIKPFLREDCGKETLGKCFGSLPVYDVGMRCGGDDLTLLEPIVQIYASNMETAVDLKAFTDRNKYPLFSSFYQALNIVAQSL